jgi:hypothetical protein
MTWQRSLRFPQSGAGPNHRKSSAFYWTPSSVHCVWTLLMRALPAGLTLRPAKWFAWHSVRAQVFKRRTSAKRSTSGWHPICPYRPLVVPNPVGDSTLTIACFRLGLQDDTGILVVGSARADFPTKIEMLLLRVALNQAAIGLQESLRLGEQQRAAAELERNIAERTAQLTTANESLRDELFQRRSAQEESRALRMSWPKNWRPWGDRMNSPAVCWRRRSWQSVLQEVLNESMALQNADFGNIQLLNPQTGIWK